MFPLGAVYGIDFIQQNRSIAKIRFEHPFADPYTVISTLPLHCLTSYPLPQAAAQSFILTFDFLILLTHSVPQNFKAESSSAFILLSRFLRADLKNNLNTATQIGVRTKSGSSPQVNAHCCLATQRVSNEQLRPLPSLLKILTTPQTIYQAKSH